MSDNAVTAILASIPIIITALVTAIVKLAGIRRILDRPRQHRRTDDEYPCDHCERCEHRIEHAARKPRRASTKKD